MSYGLPIHCVKSDPLGSDFTEDTRLIMHCQSDECLGQPTLFLTWETKRNLNSTKCCEASFINDIPLYENMKVSTET